MAKDKKKSDVAADSEAMVSEPKKKKKYERKLCVLDASEVAKFLTLNAISFKSEYDGMLKCVIRVDEENRKLFDELVDRLQG